MMCYHCLMMKPLSIKVRDRQQMTPILGRLNPWGHRASWYTNRCPNWTLSDFWWNKCHKSLPEVPAELADNERWSKKGSVVIDKFTVYRDSNWLLWDIFKGSCGNVCRLYRALSAQIYVQDEEASNLHWQASVTWFGIITECSFCIVCFVLYIAFSNFDFSQSK